MIFRFKKLFSLLLSAALMLSVLMLCIHAIPTVGDTAADVLAKYVAGTKTDTYKVSLTWGSMQFVYTAKSQTWDPDTHTWQDVSSASWTPDTADADLITVVNHSSLDVTADLAFVPADGCGVTGGVFTHDGSSVSSVTVGDATSGSAVTETVSFMPVGALVRTASNTSAFDIIGKITVTLH